MSFIIQLPVLLHLDLYNRVEKERERETEREREREREKGREFCSGVGPQHARLHGPCAA